MSSEEAHNIGDFGRFFPRLEEEARSADITKTEFRLFLQLLQDGLRNTAARLNDNTAPAHSLAEFFQFTVELDFASVDEGDAVADTLDLVQVMGTEEHCLLFNTGDIQQDFSYFNLSRRVDA